MPRSRPMVTGPPPGKGEVAAGPPGSPQLDLDPVLVPGLTGRETGRGPVRRTTGAMNTKPRVSRVPASPDSRQTCTDRREAGIGLENHPPPRIIADVVLTGRYPERLERERSTSTPEHRRLRRQRRGSPDAVFDGLSAPRPFPVTAAVPILPCRDGLTHGTRALRHAALGSRSAQRGRQDEPGGTRC